MIGILVIAKNKKLKQSKSWRSIELIKVFE